MAGFILCREIESLVLKRNDQSRAILINNNDLVTFTPMEYTLITALLHNTMVKDTQLIEGLFHTNNVDQPLLIALKKHVENANHKLRHTKLTIRRIHGYGYILLAEHAIECTAAAS